jgi:hypothetical protein
MSNNYYLDRNRRNMRKLNEMLGELPPFCSVFFIGIQDTTTPLTRLNYAVDLKLFFNYFLLQRKHNGKDEFKIIHFNLKKGK